jgi:hypothetical protein
MYLPSCKHHQSRTKPPDAIRGLDTRHTYCTPSACSTCQHILYLRSDVSQPLIVCSPCFPISTSHRLIRSKTHKIRWRSVLTHLRPIRSDTPCELFEVRAQTMREYFDDIDLLLKNTHTHPSSFVVPPLLYPLSHPLSYSLPTSFVSLDVH